MRIEAKIYVPARGILTCSADSEMALQPGETVVVQLDKILDCGSVEELAACSTGLNERPPGDVIRRLTDADKRRQNDNQKLADDALALFKARARAAELWIKPLAAHYNLDRECLSILFGSEDEIDLRRLSALLQPDVKCRIEFRQVNARDEAALIGGLGACGRSLCCCSWQKDFRAVNVRMAKVQEISPNPAVINGSCGRLKCCLRFEYSQYCEAGAQLPVFGAEVIWPEGRGTVIGRDVMNGILVVRSSEGKHLRMPAANVTTVSSTEPSALSTGSAGGKRERNENHDSERAESGPPGEA